MEDTGNVEGQWMRYYEEAAHRRRLAGDEDLVKRYLEQRQRRHRLVAACLSGLEVVILVVGYTILAHR